jgi:hypothetical protein
MKILPSLNVELSNGPMLASGRAESTELWNAPSLAQSLPQVPMIAVESCDPIAA